MKTYSKLLNRFSVLGSLLLIFGATNASASSEIVEIPASCEETLPEISSVPPSNLQIVSVIPAEFNGGVHIRCFGQNNGSATAEVTGGTGPYTFQWSGLPNQTGATAYGMSAGTYTVTVTDAIGVSVSETVTLIQNPPIQGVVNASPILCHGGVSTIVISSTGGTAPVSGSNWYQFPSGTYSFTVADANGCRSKVLTTITEPEEFHATSFATPIMCNGDVSNVSVQGFGGVAPYNGTGSYSETAGTSNYVITDANGCYAYTSVLISEPAALVAEVEFPPIQCRGGQTEVTVTGAGGIAPYQGTGVANYLAGQYSFTIEDANGCQSTSSVVIEQPTALVAMISNTPIACNGDVSEVTVTASGGDSPYTGTGTYFETSGFYSYDVTDANGCIVEIATLINEPSPIVVDVTVGPVDADLGTADVDISATGGMAPYSGTGSYNLASGSYFFTVTDANGCSVSQSVSVGGAASPSSIMTGNNGNPVFSAKSNEINNDNNSFVRASFNTNSEKLEFAYQLKYDSKVRIEILDMTGALVEVIQEDMAIEGEKYTATLESGRLKTGVYIYQFLTDSERQIDKLQVIR